MRLRLALKPTIVDLRANPQAWFIKNHSIAARKSCVMKGLLILEPHMCSMFSRLRRRRFVATAGKSRMRALVFACRPT